MLYLYILVVFTADHRPIGVRVQSLKKCEQMKANLPPQWRVEQVECVKVLDR